MLKYVYLVLQMTYLDKQVQSQTPLRQKKLYKLRLLY